jgi:hypothetical protein
MNENNDAQDSVAMLTQRHVQAQALVIEAHADQKRKGTKIPYILHLLAVGAIALEHGANQHCRKSVLAVITT